MNRTQEKYNLHNLRVLVTRPGYGGETLCQTINEHGGIAIHFPTIIFLPPVDLALFEKEIISLDQKDWLVFISPQAVYACKQALQTYWPKFPWQVQVAAVGLGTANVLQKSQLPVHAYPTENWNSEGILDLPAFQKISGKKIVIVRGEGGRTVLAEQLTRRGALVSHLIAYQRSKPIVDVSEYMALLKANVLDAVVCASAEGLDNLKELLRPAWQFLQFVPLVVVSPRLVEIARELEFKKILLAKNPSHDAIMEILSYI